MSKERLVELRGNKKQNEFIKQIKEIKDYWISFPDKSTEEIADGILYSLLTMIDGYYGGNGFQPLEIIDTTDGERIDCGFLHELYHMEELLAAVEEEI